MSFDPRKLSMSVVAILAAALLACSAKESGAGGKGGFSGTAGTTRSGGTLASGGTPSTGGSTASGGTMSGGGSLGSGGTSMSGGNAGSGGMTATDGAVASGGTTVPDGAAGSGRATGGRTGLAGATATGGGSGGRTGTAGSSADGGSRTGGALGSGGATSTVDCTDTSTTTKAFTKQYEDGSLAVTGSNKTYWTMTNWWHKFGGQTVTLDGLSMKLGNPQDTSVPASDGNPMGFPSIFIGTYQNKATVDSNLPKKVSDIQSVPTVFRTNSSSVDTANLNAAYDVWFTASDAPLSSPRANNPGAGGAYLMVWLFKPEQRRPRGGVPQTTGDNTPNHVAQTVDGLPGTWDVWIDNTDPLCISYVASAPVDDLAFDLNDFIQDSVTKQYGITASMYLSIIFAGFEVWAGGDGLECKQFCAAVN